MNQRLHRPPVVGYVVGSVVAVAVVVVSLFVARGSWAILAMFVYGAPLLLVAAGVMWMTHQLSIAVVLQYQQVLIAAGCGAVAGLMAAPSLGAHTVLVGAAAAAAGRAVAIRWTGVRPRGSG